MGGERGRKGKRKRSKEKEKSDNMDLGETWIIK